MLLPEVEVMERGRKGSIPINWFYFWAAVDIWYFTHFTILNIREAEQDFQRMKSQGKCLNNNTDNSAFNHQQNFIINIDNYLPNNIKYSCSFTTNDNIYKSKIWILILQDELFGSK